MRWWWWLGVVPGVAQAGATVESTGTWYPTIGQAITAAPTGGTVVIDAGVHDEDLVIGKTLTLVGAGQAATRVQGVVSPSVVSLTSVGTVTLRDLLVDGDGNRGIDVQAGALVAERVTVEDGSTAGNGGGINVAGASATLTDSAVWLSSAARGGAVSVSSGGALVAVDSTFQGTTASIDGGAIYTSGSTVDCTRCVFDVTQATGDGGAIRSTLGSQVALTESWAYFTAAGSDGGVVYIDGGGALTVTDLVVEGAIASALGGAFAVTGGAAIDLWGVWDAGSQALLGGFLHASGAAEPLILRRSTLCGTRSTSGDLIWSDGDATVENVVLQDVQGQIGVHVRTGHLRAYNNAVLSSDITGFYAYQGTYAIFNNVVAWSDIAAEQSQSTGTAQQNLMYLNTTANYVGLSSTGDQLNQDPMFLAYSDDGDCTNDLLFAQEDSPLRDNGSTTLADLDGTWSDIGPGGGPHADPAWYVDADGDDILGLYDCDDGNAAIYQGATEICDGFDNDCDGLTDPNGSPGGALYYLDADGDGHGSTSDFGVVSCTQPPGRVANSTDCDDNNGQVYPGAVEVCSDAGDDRNCDGDPDAGAIDADLWSYDGDGDGYGDEDNEGLFCQSPGAGWLIGAGEDCDDTSDTIHPNQPDDCDFIDDNCSGNEADAPGYLWTYHDGDGDGFGHMNSVRADCVLLPGRVLVDGDCHDGDPLIYPGAPELCDFQDNDCNGRFDDGEPSQAWYRDRDGDGFGDPADMQIAFCPPAASGYVLVDGDCDDQADAVRPDAVELCDGVDNDCDGDTDLEDDSIADASSGWEDIDQDGWGAGPLIETCDPAGLAAQDGDCADGVASKNPGATEIVGNDVDEDCDGVAQPDPDDEDDLLDPDDPAKPETASCACSSSPNPSGHLGSFLLLLTAIAASRRR